MNSRKFRPLFTLAVLVFGFSLSVTAQEKTKPTLQKVEASRSLENEDQTIKLLKEKMKTASPEEKEKIEKKLRAYKASKEQEGNAYGKSKGDLKGNEFGQSRAEMAKEKEKIQNAYDEYAESEHKLMKAKASIEKSQAELDKLEKEGELSKEELESRKQKIEKAKIELEKSQVALKAQKAAIKAKREELRKVRE